MKKTELFIFRHGQTDWNRKLQLQGHTDIPLNATGREQALVLQPLLEKIQPQVIVSSDLSRAKETAEIANNQLQVPMFTTKDLRECHLGEAEGSCKEQVIEKYGARAWEQWLSDHHEDKSYAFPNGERKDVHRTRMINYLKKFVTENSQYEKVAVSTHGGSLMRIVHHCEQSPKENLHIPNCAMFQIEYHHDEGKWIFIGRVE